MAPQTNIVEILIQAKDQASKQVSEIAAGLKSVGVVADVTKGSVQALGGTISTVGATAIGTFGGLRDAIQSVRDVLDTQSGKIFLEQISNVADSAVSKLAPLSKVIKGITSAGKDVGGGFLSKQSAEQAQSAIFSDNGKRITQILSDSANSFGKALEANVRASKLNQEIQRKLGVGVEAFTGTLDNAIADSLISGVVGGGLPDALKGIVNQAFGADLTSIVANSFRTAAKTGLLSEVSKQLAGGSVSGAAKAFAVNAIAPNVEDGQRVVGRLSSALGGSVGRAIVGSRSEATDQFKILDEQLGGSVSELINRLAGRIPQLVDKLPLPPLAKLIANKIGVANLGSIVASNELQDFGNALSGQLFNGLEKAIPEDLRSAFAILRPLIETQKGGVGQALNSLFSVEDTSILAPLRNLALKAVDAIDGGLGAAIDSIGSGDGSLQKLATKIDEFFGGTFSSLLKDTGAIAGKNFVDGLRSTILAEVGTVIDSVDDVIVKGFQKTQEIAPKLQEPVDIAAAVVAPVAGATEPLEVFNLISEGAGKATNAIFEVSQRLAFLGLGLQALQGFVQNGPFDLLIGQNIRLQEQLLSTQASLAATNRIVVNGDRVSDPTQAIKAVGPAVEGAIDKIRKDSLELVGVTSKDLVGVFQIVAGQASNIGASLNDAANITTSFAAALGTLGIPLYQARQEVVSITSGTIDQNSALAKSLNLNNEMVAKWKSQGTFVKELLGRLEAFKSGNKLAAQSVGGIVSNIQELVDEIGRLAGEKFLAPLVAELDGFYQYFSKNKDAIAAQVGSLAGILFDVFKNVIATLKSLAGPFFQIFGQVPEYLFKSLAGAVKAFSDAMSLTLAVVQPAINVFEQIAGVVGPLGGIWIGISVGAKVLSGAIGALNKGFSLMFNLVPGLGEVLFLLDKRTNGVVNTFANLSSVVGRGSAGFLLLAENLNKIPGAAGLVQKELGKVLGAFSPFAGVITAALPTLGGFGVKLIGLTQAFPALGTALQGFTKAAPIALTAFSGIVGKSQLFGSFSPLIADAAKSLGKFADVATNTEKVNSIFSNSLKAAGAAARSFAVSTALLGAGTFVGFVFFDQLILKNKGLQKIIQDVTAAIRKFADTVGSVLAPVIKVVADTILPFFTFGENSNPFQKVVGGLLIAIAVTKLFGGTISNVFKTINTGISGAGASIGETFGRIKKLNDSVREILGGKPVQSTTLNPTQVVAAKREVSGLKQQAIVSQKDSTDLSLTPEARAAALKSYQETTDRIKSLRSQIIANPIPVPFTKQFAEDIGAIATKTKTSLKSLGDSIGSFISDIKGRFSQDSSQKTGIFANLPAQIENTKASIRNAFANINIPASLVNLRNGVEKAFSQINVPTSLANARLGLDKFFRELNIPASLANSRIAIDKFVNQVKSISLPDLSLKNLGAGLKTGFQDALSGVKDFGSRAKSSFADFTQNANVSVGGLYSNLKKGAVGATSFISENVKGISKSFAALAAEIGPTLLLSAAFAAITTLVGYVDQETKAATANVDKLNDALKDSDARVAILNKSQGKDAASELANLTSEREKYVASIQDKSILQDDPTLKLYDQQLAKLKELRGLQSKPTNSEDALREKVKKERDNIGTRVTEGFALTGDAAREGLRTVTFGASDKLGLGDRAGNLEEKAVQIRLQDNKNVLNQSASRRVDLGIGLSAQKKLQEDLIKLEQEKSKAEALSDKDGAARFDIQIENKKKEIAERNNNIEAIINQVQAVEGLDAERDRELEALRKLQESYKSVNLQIQAIDLPRIGNAIEQATSKYNAALDALNKSAGDPALFKAKLGELLETANALQDAGILRADEVAGAFQKVATNVSADRDLQIKAQEAITAAYKKEADRRIAIYDAQLSQIQALLATGRISESESIALSGQLEEKKIQAQSEADQKALRARQQILETNANEQKQQIKRDRELAEAQLAAATGDPSKIRQVREAQAPVLQGKIDDTSQQIKDAEARKKALQESISTGVAGDNAAEDVKKVTDELAVLQSRLNSLQSQKGTLDSTLKLSEDTQGQLEGITKQIEDGEKALSSLKAGNAETLQRFNTVKDAPFFNSSEYTAQIKAEQDAIAKKESELRTLQTKRDQLSSIAKPDAERQNLAKNSIADANKKELDLVKATAAQKARLEEDADNKRKDAEAKIAKARSERFVKGLDAQIKETLAAEKVGETQRLAQIAQLRKSGIKLESEIKLQETAERKRSITLELQLEQQKQKAIADLEKKGVGVSKETKNANLIKVAELSKQLAEAELAAIEGLVSAVRDRLVLESQKYAVTIEQQNLKLERQKLLFTALEKGLENQSRLSESANKLAQSTVALRESEFAALNKIYDRQQAAIRAAGGQGNFADLELEEKKLILAEKLAVLKLNSLKQQQKFEAESLEREIQKRDLLLERKKVENEIAIAKKKVDIASQDAAIKAAELEVKLRPQSEEAKLKLAQAKLGQEKNFLELGGLQQEKGFIADEAKVNEIVNKNDRQALANKQQGETNTAIGDVIGATRDPALQERLQREQLARLTQNTGTAALTTTDVSNAVAAASQPVNVRGASFKNPTSALLGQVEQGGVFTAAPEPKPDNAPFATSFEELAKKYPDKGMAGSFEELNKKYPAQANSFEELNAKYGGKPTEEAKPEQAIASSFDKLTQQIDEGFSKVLVAPDLKVKDLTAGLEAEFNRVSKQISENPVTLKIDDKAFEEAQKKLDKPIALLDEGQLQRAEALAQAFGSLGGKDLVPQQQGNPTGAALGTSGNITVNAPIAINTQSNISSAAGVGNDVQKAVNDTLNNVLRRVAGVTSGVR